jgi:peptide/nickel transport system permease protein
MAALALLTMALVAIFAAQVATHDPLLQDIPNRLRKPSSDFLFGTDGFGRDTFSRVVHGARVSAYVGGLSVVLATIVGVFTGIASAYLGGKVDMAVQRVVDTLIAFPSLVLALVMVAVLGPSVNNIVAAISVALAPQIARMARSQAFSIKQESYVSAAVSIGARPLRVMLRHILPNSLAPIVVQASGYLEQAVVAEAALSFLGLGIPPPFPSWGRMLQEGAQGYMEAAPWLMLFPGLALALAVFSFAVIGDALRDLLDPRMPLGSPRIRRTGGVTRR